MLTFVISMIELGDADWLRGVMAKSYLYKVLENVKKVIKCWRKYKLLEKSLAGVRFDKKLRC